MNTQRKLIAAMSLCAAVAVLGFRLVHLSAA